MSLMIIPITDPEDETATAYGSSIGGYVEGQTSITFDQLVTLCECSKEELEAMTPEQRGEYLVEHVGLYTIDALAVVDEKHATVIKKLSDQALSNGTDSALYAACSMFNAAVLGMAEKVIPLYGEEIEKCDY